MFKKMMLALAVCATLTTPAMATEVRIVRVVDGDTLIVQREGEEATTRVRLYGVDCPEGKQPYGQAATDFVISVFEETGISEVVHRSTHRNRSVSVVYLESGETLQELLLTKGLAWVDPRFCRNRGLCPGWKLIEAEAQLHGAGLWADDSPVEPWEWRRGKK